MVIDEGAIFNLFPINFSRSLLARPPMGGDVSFTPRHPPVSPVRRLTDERGITRTFTVTPSL